MWRGPAPTGVVDPRDALPGRDEPIPTLAAHRVHGRPLHPPWPEGHRLLVVGMGCFWGAERLYWSLPGVHTTFVGYAGGTTPNPTYEEVCSGMTGHAEVAGVVHDPQQADLESLLAVFWENHDPTQVLRQGNDVGSQYRSIILVDDEQAEVAVASRRHYQHRLDEAGHGAIATTIEPLGAVYHAEAFHQQYLHAVPNGYCNHGFCQAAY
jgi:peptide-methionine (S)-S-oxide reductase